MKLEPSDYLQQIFIAAYRQVTQRARAPVIVAYFYPFADLTHTIRSRSGSITVKVSDLLCEAPLPVLQAVARLLIARLLKQRSSADDQQLYRQYALEAAVQRAIAAARRQREAPPPDNPVGEVHDLSRLFARLNQRYFNNSLPQPVLGWSRRPTRRLLGHHDYAHQAIVMSCVLDKADIPVFVLEFLVYHEMLHLKHPPRTINGRHHYHTAAFRADEERFARYDEAMDWLDEFALQPKK
jgi:hypothetical protein